MNILRSAFAHRAAVAIFAVIGATLPQFALAQTAPSLAGTWNFIPERSTFTPATASYKSLTLKATESGDTTVEGVDASGKPVKLTYSAVVDGKPHPVTGNNAFDTGMWTKNSETNTSYRYLKAKSIAVLGSRVLSTDGSTLTFREQVYDAKGKQTSVSVMVFVNPDIKVASVVPPAAAAPPVAQPALTPAETAAADVLAKGNDDEAIKMFTAVIETKPAPAMLYYDHISRGIAFARKGQNEQALADFDAAVTLKPDNMDARFRRGGTRVTLKQYEAALDDLNTVIKADEMNAAAYRVRGFAYNFLGKTTEGAADNDKACMINKDFCPN